MFYGWKISTLCLAGNFLLQGSALYGMNAFMEPLCEAHGWTRVGLNMSLGVAAFMGQAAMPLAAAVSARHSLRGLMTAGAVAGGLATCAMGVTGDIRLFTCFLVLLWVASQVCGGVVANALMSNWFSHYRGIAFGLANAGTNVSGMVLPFITLLLIRHFDLQTAYFVLGGATLLLAPVCWVLVRRTPQMLHLHPDGRRHDPRPPKGVPRQVSLAALVRDPAPWCIGVAFGLALMVGAGVLSQLKPRFTDMGAEAYTAMILAGAAAFFGMLAKFFWGWLCDRTTPILASRALMMGSAASMGLLLLPPSLASMAAFGFFFGVSLGGLWVVLPAVVAYYFGSANFLSVYKFVAIFILVRSLGFPAMGLSYDLCGSYAFSDIFFSACLVVAAALTFCLREDKAAERHAPRHGRR
ncbi:MAG: MFS transporter [Desulfovibrio sp.]|nr:MFS transporter [Desulfovibrio sp.]